MAITIADITKIRPSTTPKRLPGTLLADMLNPGPVMFHTVAGGSGNPGLVRATAAHSQAFAGINVESNRIGDGSQAVPALSGCILTGYSGVTAQASVWIDATATPNPEGVFSGLTHTDPADGTPPIGVGLPGGKIYIFQR